MHLIEACHSFLDRYTLGAYQMGKARHFEIDHTKKYKVFNLYNSENEVVTRVSGAGDELPYSRMRHLLVGQECGAPYGRYERVL